MAGVVKVLGVGWEPQIYKDFSLGGGGGIPSDLFYFEAYITFDVNVISHDHYNINHSYINYRQILHQR